jgi:hypothetical protein
MESCTCDASSSQSWMGKSMSVVPRAPMNQFFECLDCLFSSVDTVIARFDKLEATLLWAKVRFDCFCHLIVHDVDLWGVPFAHKKFEVLFVCV